MRLYVWENYCPDYTSGLAIALANSLGEAKNLIRKEYNFGFGVGCAGYEPKWGEFKTYAIDSPIAFEVSGGS